MMTAAAARRRNRPPCRCRSARAPTTSRSAAACSRTLGPRIATLGPAARPRSSPTRPWRRTISTAAEAALAAAGIRTTPIVVPPGEATKSWRMLEEVCDRAARCADRAQRCRRCARRRRGRRPCGLRRRHRAARPRLRAGADHAAGASRFVRRRQDRDQLATRQESHRRVPSADPGHRRYRAARHAAEARLPRRLRRGREIRPARRRRLLRLARSQLAGRVFGRHRAGILRANMRSRSHAAARPESWRATSARPASARCSISATRSVTHSRRRPAFPTSCCTARRSRSASLRVRVFGAARAPAAARTRTARSRHLAAVGLADPHVARCRR